MIKFAYHLETKRVRDPDFPYRGKNFTNPEAVAEFCRFLQDSDVEKMIFLHLSTKNNLIGIKIFAGTVDRSVPLKGPINTLAGSGKSIPILNNTSSTFTMLGEWG